VITGFGVIALLIWNLAVITLLGVLFFLSVRSGIPDLRLRLHIDREHWAASLRYGLSIIGYQVLGNALLLFERGWIVRRFGTAALTFYVVPMMLGFYFHAFISSIVLVLFPSMNELIQEPEKLVSLYKLATKIVFGMTAFFLVTCIVCGRAFLTVWMGADFAAASYQILVFHSVTFAILAITVLAWQINETFRATVLNVIATVAWLAISFPAMVFLSHAMQASGVAFGRLLGILAYLPLIFVAERRFLGARQYQFWLPLMLRVLAATALAGLSEWAILSVLAGWPGVALAVMTGGLLATTSLYVSGLLTPAETASFAGFIPRRQRV